jgi:hypothetical protein
VIQVRKHRETNQSQRSIAAGGWLPADEVLPDVGAITSDMMCSRSFDKSDHWPPPD